MLYLRRNTKRKGEKMTLLTAAQCAENVGVSKRTIQNKIKQGKLSAIRDDNGFYLVDSSELMRVYPSANNQEKHQECSRENIYEVRSKIVTLETENQGLKKQIEILTKQLDKSENREEKLLKIASETQKLLENSSKKRRKFLGIF